MMELHDVVNAVNTFIPKEKGMLVLHRNMQEHKKFKAYKIFNYNLWLVKGKEKEAVMSYSETVNTPMDKILETWNKMDKKFLVDLMSAAMYGKLNSYGTKQISDTTD